MHLALSINPTQTLYTFPHDNSTSLYAHTQCYQPHRPMSRPLPTAGINKQVFTATKVFTQYLFTSTHFHYRSLNKHVTFMTIYFAHFHFHFQIVKSAKLNYQTANFYVQHIVWLTLSFHHFTYYKYLHVSF